MSQGICKSAFKIQKPQRSVAETTSSPLRKDDVKREPGRFVGAKYIPNRIFRGRIVDALRDHHDGLTLGDLGPLIAPDWAEEHVEWLGGLLVKLVNDELIAEKSRRYFLQE